MKMGKKKGKRKIFTSVPRAEVIISGEEIRNNIGSWKTRQIPNPENLSGRSRYQLKDKAMADDCDCGMMFWDGRSKGTKDNIEYMEALGKYYLVLSRGFLSGGNWHKSNDMIIS